MIGVVLAFLAGVAVCCGWLLLNPACRECGARRPITRQCVVALALGIYVAVLVLV